MVVPPEVLVPEVPDLSIDRTVLPGRPSGARETLALSYLREVFDLRDTLLAHLFGHLEERTRIVRTGRDMPERSWLEVGEGLPRSEFVHVRTK